VSSSASHPDADTGLENADHRWYDPAVGRWISEDPIGFRGRDANVSRYVGNGATNRTDPTGMAFVSRDPFTPVPPKRGFWAGVAGIAGGVIAGGVVGGVANGVLGGLGGGGQGGAPVGGGGPGGGGQGGGGGGAIGGGGQGGMVGGAGPVPKGAVPITDPVGIIKENWAEIILLGSAINGLGGGGGDPIDPGDLQKAADMAKELKDLEATIERGIEIHGTDLGIRADFDREGKARRRGSLS